MTTKRIPMPETDALCHRGICTQDQCAHCTTIREINAALDAAAQPRTVWALYVDTKHWIEGLELHATELDCYESLGNMIEGIDYDAAPSTTDPTARIEWLKEQIGDGSFTRYFVQEVTTP